jgi:hypothetical protein
MTVEKILQAMIVFRNKYSDALTVGRVGEAPLHLKIAGDEREVFSKLRQVEVEIFRIKLDACKEEIGGFVSVLIGEKNVAVVLEDKICDGGDNAFAVRARDEKDGGLLHRQELQPKYFAGTIYLLF